LGWFGDQNGFKDVEDRNETVQKRCSDQCTPNQLKTRKCQPTTDAVASGTSDQVTQHWDTLLGTISAAKARIKLFEDRKDLQKQGINTISGIVGPAYHDFRPR
jgi:hypothetical protein